MATKKSFSGFVKRSVSLTDDYNLNGDTYKKEEIDAIIERNDISELRDLSRALYASNVFYKRFVNYYSTLLNFTTLTIPICKSADTQDFSEKYFELIGLVDRINLQQLGPYVMGRMFVEGSYYGLVHKSDTTVLLQDLPVDYCRCRFKNVDGIKVIEFNVQFFQTIADLDEREIVLQSFPKNVQQRYRLSGGMGEAWEVIEPKESLCVFVDEGKPFFLNLIKTIADVDGFKNIEKKKALQQLSKILYQEFPITRDKDGNLDYDLEDLEGIHEAVGDILEDTFGLDVVSTPFKPTLLSLQEEKNVQNNNLENYNKMLYDDAAISRQLFNADGSVGLSYATKIDLAFLIYAVSDLQTWLNSVVAVDYEEKDCSFRINILPISKTNEKEYLDNALKGASFGYSLLLPFLAQGIRQSEIVGLKKLENDILNLHDQLKPISSAHTKGGEDSAPGRDTKPIEEKDDKSIVTQGD